MNSIVVNYVLENPITSDNIRSIIDGCISKKYKIHLNFYDFRLNKNLQSIIDDIKVDKNTVIKIFEKDYEDKKDGTDIIINHCLQFSDSLSMIIFNSYSIINKGALDQIDFSLFTNKNLGFLYTDYTINKIRCYLLSHIGGINMNVPIIFWSMPKVIEHLSQDTLKNIASKSAGIHIPESFFSINNHE